MKSFKFIPLIVFATLGVMLTAPQAKAIDCALPVENPYKVQSSNTVFYLNNDCEMFAIDSEEKYLSLFQTWDMVVTISQGELDSFQPNTEDFVNWGPYTELKNGELFRIADRNSRVYLHIDGGAFPIDSEEVFVGNGYQWGWVRVMNYSISTSYRFWNPRTGRSARVISDTNWLPLGTMVRVDGSPMVYVLEVNDGTKEWNWVDSMEELRTSGFHEGRIPVITEEVWEQYQAEWPDEYWCYEYSKQDEPVLRAFSIVPWHQVHLTPGYSTATYLVDSELDCQSEES